MIHFIRFNVVGVIGFALQLGALFVFTHSAHPVNYLAATAAAVELAILNNFIWHQHWTWRDRPSATTGETLRRLAKFNITNGAVSITGNLLFMSILVGRMRLPITGANVASVSACSICNFFLADRIAFHAERSRRRKHFLQSEPHTVPVSPYFGNDKVERSCRLIFIPKESRHMDPDPMQFVEDDNDKKDAKAVLEVHKSRAQLNTLVAIAVALLATFMGICKVKDDNIVQAMQQAQADKIDNYSWYQARNVREEVANATVAQLTAQAAAAPPQAKAVFEEKIKTYQAIASEQADKKKIQQADADKADKTYNELNFHDDQFDLSDAMLALAISLLAVTALTQKRWLFVLAMLPTVFGVTMGMAGLFGWHIHPDSLTKLLS